MDEMWNILIRAGMTPNQLYVIWSKSTTVAALNINVHAEERGLRNKKLLTSTGDPTPEALQALKDVQAHFKKSKKKSNKSVMGEDWDKNLDIFNSYFKKERLSSGKNARSTKKNIEPAMRWFFNEHDFTWEEVFAATSAYNDDQDLKGAKYKTCSQYFIRKGQPDRSWISMLGDWCQSVRDGVDGPVEDPFKETVFGGK
jgi:hypothetical protein